MNFIMMVLDGQLVVNLVNYGNAVKMNNNLEVSLVKELCPVCGKEIDGEEFGKKLGVFKDG